MQQEIGKGLDAVILDINDGGDGAGESLSTLTERGPEAGV